VILHNEEFHYELCSLPNTFRRCEVKEVGSCGICITGGETGDSYWIVVKKIARKEVIWKTEKEIKS
jgi:hypothetical protein